MQLALLAHLYEVIPLADEVVDFLEKLIHTTRFGTEARFLCVLTLYWDQSCVYTLDVLFLPTFLLYRFIDSLLLIGLDLLSSLVDRLVLPILNFTLDDSSALLTDDWTKRVLLLLLLSQRFNLL